MKTPPLILVKGINKVYLQSIRATNLKATLESTNFINLEDNKEDNNLDLLLVYKGLVSKRASIITRQLI